MRLHVVVGMSWLDVLILKPSGILVCLPLTLASVRSWHRGAGEALPQHRGLGCATQQRGSTLAGLSGGPNSRINQPPAIYKWMPRSPQPYGNERISGVWRACVTRSRPVCASSCAGKRPGFVCSRHQMGSNYECDKRVIWQTLCGPAAA